MRGEARVAAGALTALLLSACGVPQDERPRALESGEAPFASPTESAVAPEVGDRRVALGFVRDDAVVLSNRTVQDPPTPEQVLELLFAGPSPAEREAGLLTVLPSTVTVEDVELAGGTAVVTLGGPDSEVLRLQPLAYAQVVATLTPDRVSGVRFRLDETDLRVPREDGSLTQRPLSRRDYAGLVAPPATVDPAPSA